jgi:hypothetical protein
MEKIMIIEELNKMKYLLNYKRGIVISEQNHLIKELDIYDDKIETLIDELKSDGGDSLMAEIGITNDGLSSTENLTKELSGKTNMLEVCNIDGYIENKLGSSINNKFPGKADKVIKFIKEYIDKFMVFLDKLTIEDLKQLFKDIKSKKSEADELMLSGGTSSEVVSEGMINEFFGTSMVVITLFGGFAMPALVLSIASIALVTLIGLSLLKMIFCKFRIVLPYYGKAACGRMNWGKRIISCS